MRNPNRQDKAAKQIIKLAANYEQDKILRITEILQETAKANPFLPLADQKKQALKTAIKEGFNDVEAERLIRGASQVMNTLDSGAKLFQSDALLDSLINKAQHHLMRDVYSKTGDVIGEEFNVEVMNAIVKAVKAKMDTLTKVQQNLISAQKEANTQNENKTLDITDLEREQLERFVSGELINHPEIMHKITQRKSTEEELFQFHESLDGE